MSEREEGRDYFVTVTVELADGEPRQEGEYGWSSGIRVRVYDWGCPSSMWIPETLGKDMQQYLKNAVEDEKDRTRNNKWWRRLFRG